MITYSDNIKSLLVKSYQTNDNKDVLFWVYFKFDFQGHDSGKDSICMRCFFMKIGSNEYSNWRNNIKHYRLNCQIRNIERGQLSNLKLKNIMSLFFLFVKTSQKIKLRWYFTIKLYPIKSKSPHYFVSFSNLTQQETHKTEIWNLRLNRCFVSHISSDKNTNPSLNARSMPHAAATLRVLWVCCRCELQKSLLENFCEAIEMALLFSTIKRLDKVLLTIHVR